MSIISYDPVNGRVYGSIFFPEISGSFLIDIWENIALDCQAIAELNTSGQLMFTGWITPFFKFIGDLPSYSFTSVPDTRYKFGSYSYNTGYVITLDENDDPIPVAIPGTPNYIIYPLQVLEVSRFAMPYPGTSVFQFQVIFEANTIVNPNTFIINPRANSSNAPSNFIASSLSLNLNPSIIADIKLYYSYSVTFVDNFAHDGELQPILV